MRGFLPLAAACAALTACGDKADVPDIIPLERGRIERFPNPDGAARLPTPVGPAEGHGHAWTAKIGGSPRDFPGAGVVQLPPDDGCARVTEARCTPYDPIGCRAILDERLTAGPDLLDLELPLEIGGAAHLGRSAARLVAEVRDATSTRLHLGLPAAPDLTGVWASIGEADLYTWRTTFDDAAGGGDLALLNQTLRSLGARGVLDAPPDGKWDDDRATLLGLHLATGGVVDGTLAGAGQAAADWAAAHPEVFGRLRARVALAVPVRALRGPDGRSVAARLAGAARLLDASKFPWDAVVLGDGDRVDDAFDPGRLARHGLVVVAGGDALHPDEWETILGATTAPVLVWESGEASTLPEEIDPSRVMTMAEPELAQLGWKPDRSTLQARVRAFDVDGEELVDTARRSDGAVDANNLPLGITIVPRWAPEAGLIVHHLVDAGRLDGKAAPGSDGGFEIEIHYERAGDLAECVATWHLPASGEEHDLPCRTHSLGPSIHLKLPAVEAFPPWSVVTTKLVTPARPTNPGKIQLSVSGSGEWLSDSVPFEIPVLAPDQRFAVTMPEWLEVLDDAGGREHIDPAPWPAELTLEGNRTAATLTRRGDGLTVATSMVTSKRRIDLEMTVTNTSDAELAEVVALLCASSKGATPFPESGHANTYVWTPDGRERLEDRPVDEGEALYHYRRDIADPVTALESVDGAWTMATAFESSAGAGGNAGGGGVCIHSRPRFGPLAPGKSQTRRGFIFVGPGGELTVPTEWAVEAPPRGEDDSDRWAAACSDEGRARLAAGGARGGRPSRRSIAGQSGATISIAGTGPGSHSSRSA